MNKAPLHWLAASGPWRLCIVFLWLPDHKWWFRLRAEPFSECSEFSHETFFFFCLLRYVCGFDILVRERDLEQAQIEDDYCLLFTPLKYFVMLVFTRFSFLQFTSFLTLMWSRWPLQLLTTLTWLMLWTPITTLVAKTATRSREVGGGRYCVFFLSVFIHITYHIISKHCILLIHKYIY